MPPSPRSAGRTHRVPGTVLSFLLLALGVTGFAAVWVMVALSTGQLHGWMALLGALDVVIVVRLGTWQPGILRALLAALATAAIAAIANWWIIAAHLGAMLGMPPWSSALKLGVNHASTLAGVANGPADLILVSIAVVVAAFASR